MILDCDEILSQHHQGKENELSSITQHLKTTENLVIWG